MTDALTPRRADLAELVFQPLAADEHARQCAAIMSTTEPWLTFGRTFDESYALVRDPTREVCVALEPATAGASRVAGFTILVMQGAFVGYIQSIAVRADWRGRGLGSALIELAERRVLRETPNVFICVSSFNPAARRLYERLGYQVVGQLPDFIVRGHAETLMRKTTGPLAGCHSERSEESQSSR